jgi:hypothetical protein
LFFCSELWAREPRLVVSGCEPRRLLSYRHAHGPRRSRQSADQLHGHELHGRRAHLRIRGHLRWSVQDCDHIMPDRARGTHTIFPPST